MTQLTTPFTAITPEFARGLDQRALAAHTWRASRSMMRWFLTGWLCVIGAWSMAPLILLTRNGDTMRGFANGLRDLSGTLRANHGEALGAYTVLCAEIDRRKAPSRNRTA